MFRKTVTQRQLRRLRKIVVGNLAWFKVLGTDQQDSLRPTAYRLTGSKSRIARAINEHMYWHHIEDIRMRPLVNTPKWDKLVQRDKELYEITTPDFYEEGRRKRIQFVNGIFGNFYVVFIVIASRGYDLIHFKKTKHYKAEEAALVAESISRLNTIPEHTSKEK